MYMEKEKFKSYVKLHPELITFVKNNEMSWQKFYELYSLYGEDEKVWDPYLKKEVNQTSSNITTNNSHLTFSDLIGMAKKINPEQLQSGITSLQKALGLVQDLVIKDKGTKEVVNNYIPRAINRRFED